jgi:acyl-CoA synthetase (AMP-forming)/AMP-acid ligase II
MDGDTLSYGQVQELSWQVARALQDSGVRAGDKVAILSGNDPHAFACVFGISRAAAVWCPINPRNEVAENQELLELFDCSFLFFHSSFVDMASVVAVRLPQLKALVCVDQPCGGFPSLAQWLENVAATPFEVEPIDDVVMLVGTGGTTGRPKGVVLTSRNVEAMSAITLMSYPIGDRPRYLALAPLTHAAGVLCFPIMAKGGRIVVMPKPDITRFLALIEEHRITHAFLPPTLIYLLLADEQVGAMDLSSLECLWYGAAPMSAARLAEAIGRLGPVLGQLFGQSEAPMMVSTLSPAEHLRLDGSLATERFSSAGRPSPLTQVAVMADDGRLLATGERGEIVVRGSLVMAGYYKNPQATKEVGRYGWHHTGDIGYLDADGYLYIVDRAKDMIITGGFNVYSTEVEQALMRHPAVADCAVIGLPDEKWGEQVAAVAKLRAGSHATATELRAFVKSELGSVKAPKRVEIWPDLPRSKLGKVLKAEIRDALR